MARWYIIHAYSGFENKVRESILAEAERLAVEALRINDRLTPAAELMSHITSLRDQGFGRRHEPAGAVQKP